MNRQPSQQSDIRQQVRQQAQAWLQSFLATYSGMAGTVHLEVGGDLLLAADQGIPDNVLAAVQRVPRGKGMAGLAQVNAEPVQTCNIQDDNTGRLKPLAKEVSGMAAIALPVSDERGTVRAVVGISFGYQGQIPPAQVAKLMKSAATLPLL